MTAAVRVDTGGLPVAPGVHSRVHAALYEPFTGWQPIHRYAGQPSGERADRAPGHCDACVVLGHIEAHPDHGCGDVRCNNSHEEEAAGGYAAAYADRCCELHLTEGCCDTDDCGPCCEKCPTCPTLNRRNTTTETDGPSQLAATIGGIARLSQALRDIVDAGMTAEQYAAYLARYAERGETDVNDVFVDWDPAGDAEVGVIHRVAIETTRAPELHYDWRDDEPCTLTGTQEVLRQGGVQLRRPVTVTYGAWEPLP